jgi:hypothetical protein
MLVGTRRQPENPRHPFEIVDRRSTSKQLKATFSDPALFFPAFRIVDAASLPFASGLSKEIRDFFVAF